MTECNIIHINMILEEEKKYTVAYLNTFIQKNGYKDINDHPIIIITDNGLFTLDKTRINTNNMTFKTIKKLVKYLDNYLIENNYYKSKTIHIDDFNCGDIKFWNRFAQELRNNI